MTDVGKNLPDGLWDALDSMEASAHLQLSSDLSPFEKPIRMCYEAGVMAPMLPSNRSQDSTFGTAGLFLKRTLNDLRAVWVLLLKGYTSQAGSVAASLYENALATVVISRSKTASSELQRSSDGELPWGAQELSKKAASIWVEEQKQNEAANNGLEYEKTWRYLYATYKWLCQIKHPTLKSTFHDSEATSLEPTSYVVMAAPDLRKENLPVKCAIAAVAFSRTHDAISAFAQTLNPDRKKESYKDFERRMTVSSKEALDAAKTLVKGNLPFTIRGSKFETVSRSRIFKK